MQDFNEGIIPEENEAEPVAETGCICPAASFFTAADIYLANPAHGD